MSKTNDPMIDDASFAFLKDLAGRDAVMAAIDLMDDDSEERYRSFYPCGDMLIGLRYRDLDTRSRNTEPIPATSMRFTTNIPRLRNSSPSPHSMS